MPDQLENNAVLIAGPTASGKSRLALDVAREVNGEIVNADAIQVYKDLNILSARPSQNDVEITPHHLFGVLGGEDRCSAGRWAQLVKVAIDEITSRGRVPIIVGGTGLYFRALTEGLSKMPDVPGEIRTQALERITEIGNEAFRNEIVSFDPAMARLAVGDTQRLLRAWEIYQTSGQPLSSFQEAPKSPVIAMPSAAIVLIPERARLYAKCNNRFDEMMNAGALKEAQKLLSRNLDRDLPVMKALGAAELVSHLCGELTLSDAIELAKRNTRRFAKRQITWFRNQTTTWAQATSSAEAQSKLLASFHT